MASNGRHARVIVNPAAGHSSTYKKWGLIQSLLRNTGLAFDVRFTEARGHGIELAREATRAGYTYLVAVGGDGTIHEVANGILQNEEDTRAALGIVNTGTGSDLGRSIGLTRDFKLACSKLTSLQRLSVDIGTVEYTQNRERRSRFFINSAGIGFDAAVVKATEQLPKFFGGTIPYLVGLVRSFLFYGNKTVTLKFEGFVEKARVLSVVVANGAYFGGGMHVAPQAKLDDKLLDTIIIGNFGKIELLKSFPRVYKGTHLTHPKVRAARVTELTIESPRRFLLHADGELLGEGPVTFGILPGALDLVI